MRISHRAVTIFLLLNLSSPSVATQQSGKPRPAPPVGSSRPTAGDEPSNPEMKRIFEADQAARTDIAGINPSKLADEDAARRERTKALLDAGELKSGDDFWHAAFVFQHGRIPQDHLLAHSLATVAIARGRADATWIAAASLDRYLQKIGQPQIYGTQYRTITGQPTTQEPYRRELVSDALRQALGVPTLKEQETRRLKFQEERQAWEKAQAKSN